MAEHTLSAAEVRKAEEFFVEHDVPAAEIPALLDKLPKFPEKIEWCDLADPDTPRRNTSPGGFSVEMIKKSAESAPPLDKF